MFISVEFTVSQTGPVRITVAARLWLQSTVLTGAVTGTNHPIERTMTGSVMKLVYRGDTWSRVFFAFCYLFLAFFVTIVSIFGFDQPLHGAKRLMPVAFLSFMAIVPVVMHLIGTRRSEEELHRLIEFLERVAKAKRTPDLQGPMPAR